MVAVPLQMCLCKSTHPVPRTCAEYLPWLFRWHSFVEHILILPYLLQYAPMVMYVYH